MSKSEGAYTGTNCLHAITGQPLASRSVDEEDEGVKLGPISANYEAWELEARREETRPERFRKAFEDLMEEAFYYAEQGFLSMTFDNFQLSPDIINDLKEQLGNRDILFEAKHINDKPGYYHVYLEWGESSYILEELDKEGVEVKNYDHSFRGSGRVSWKKKSSTPPRQNSTGCDEMLGILVFSFTATGLIIMAGKYASVFF